MLFQTVARLAKNNKFTSKELKGKLKLGSRFPSYFREFLLDGSTKIARNTVLAINCCS